MWEGTEMSDVGRSWTEPSSRHVEQIFVGLKGEFDDLKVERPGKTWDADDDNLWFIKRANCTDVVQLETNPTGDPPFLVESDWGRQEAADVEEAIRTIVAWLRD
jgi:hypothetical protein